MFVAPNHLTSNSRSPVRLYDNNFHYSAFLCCSNIIIVTEIMDLMMAQSKVKISYPHAYLFLI